MNLSDLQSFIAQVHGKLTAQHSDLDATQRNLMMLIKLTEEVGELNRAVLAHYGRQRSWDDRDPMGEVGAECADVIFAAMMVAKDFDIDIALELSRKKEKIEHRFNL